MRLLIPNIYPERVIQLTILRFARVLMVPLVTLFTSNYKLTNMSLSSEVTRMRALSSRLFKNWGTAMGVYGGVAALVGLYLTDWKVINTKIPFYGKKFDDDSNL